LTLSLPAYVPKSTFSHLNWLIPNNHQNFSELTPFRPIKSAIGPLVIAPTIAPKVKMEPNKEYCIQSVHEKARKIISNPGLVFHTGIKIHKAKGIYLTT